MIPLSTFPAPLLRLILCGGGGLSPAWGPLAHSGSTLGCGDPNRGQWAWDSVLSAAVRPDRAPAMVLDRATPWSLPLDPSSPWPARLAMVAGWMRFCPPEMVGPAFLEVHEEELILTMLTSRDGKRTATFFAVASPRRRDEPAAVYNPTTLPTRLAQHPPEAALPLALHDLPDVAARVAAAVAP